MNSIPREDSSPDDDRSAARAPLALRAAEAAEVLPEVPAPTSPSDPPSWWIQFVREAARLSRKHRTLRSPGVARQTAAKVIAERPAWERRFVTAGATRLAAVRWRLPPYPPWNRDVAEGALVVQLDGPLIGQVVSIDRLLGHASVLAKPQGAVEIPPSRSRDEARYIFGLSRHTVSPSLWGRLHRGTVVRFRATEGRFMREVEVAGSESADPAPPASPAGGAPSVGSFAPRASEPRLPRYYGA